MSQSALAGPPIAQPQRQGWLEPKAAQLYSQSHQMGRSLLSRVVPQAKHPLPRMQTQTQFGQGQISLPQEMAMKLFTGLGNPGAKYAGNRHNIGFMAMDRIAEDHGFSGWKRGYQGQVNEGRLGSEKVILLKPETFMNLSGQSVQAAMGFYKLTPEDLVVFHDELDLAPGKCRVKQGGGHAGHNGLRSISAHIGEAYARVRLGIGHPGHKDAVAHYVLHDFAKADHQDWLDDLLRGLSDGAEALAAGDAAKFMNAVSLRTAPPRSSGGERPTPPLRAKTATAAEAPAKPKPPANEKPEAKVLPEDKRSPLEKLMDKFR